MSDEFESRESVTPEQPQQDYTAPEPQQQDYTAPEQDNSYAYGQPQGGGGENGQQGFSEPQQGGYQQNAYQQDGYQQNAYQQGGYQQNTYQQGGYQQNAYGQPQQPYGAYQQPYYAQEKPKDSGTGFGIASLVCGILSLFTFACCVNFLLALAAIILGIVQLVRCQKKGLAIGGIVTAAISIVVGIGFWIAAMTAVGSNTLDPNSPLQQYLEEYLQDYDSYNQYNYYAPEDGAM